MSWEEIYRDMAFSPHKTDHARRRELQDALVTLHSYPRPGHSVVGRGVRVQPLAGVVE
jgi:hypothetical protein